VRTFDLDTIDSPETWHLALQEFVRRARAELGGRVERIVLYGSRARGDYEDESDIDLLVFVNKGEDLERIRESLSELAWEICNKYDSSFFIQRWAFTEEDFEREASYFFIRNIKREGVVV
jgi:predicted nucleotidyltransferase